MRLYHSQLIMVVHRNIVIASTFCHILLSPHLSPSRRDLSRRVATPISASQSTVLSLGHYFRIFFYSVVLCAYTHSWVPP